MCSGGRGDRHGEVAAVEPRSEVRVIACGVSLWGGAVSDGVRPWAAGRISRVQAGGRRQGGTPAARDAEENGGREPTGSPGRWAGR